MNVRTLHFPSFHRHHRSTVGEPRVVNRWVQLVAGVVAMMAIANLQYAWTLFTKPLSASLGASLPAIQVAFAAFILAETWLVPFEGYLVDKIGPRILMAFGGILVGLGWIMAGNATTVRQLIAWYTLGGVGAGVVYGATIGNAMKWFPDRRGLCVGLTAGAYGVGTALTVLPISKMIQSSGYAKTLVTWGFIQGLVVMVAALLIVKPPEGWAPEGWKEKEAKLTAHVHHAHRDVTPLQMVRTGSFWLIYLMLTMLAFGGLVVTAQLVPIATFYKVDKVTLAFGMSAVVLAIEVDRVLNGFTRPFWGWVSDHIGRENTMFIAFTLEALAVFGLLQLVHHPVWFVALSGLCFFAWGEIFSLFPAITGDLFGKRWATTNYGIVYTAKGLASIFAGPVAALASVKTGSWVPVFWAMIICDLVAALLALLWLKPLAERTIRRVDGTAAVGGTGAIPAGASARQNPES
ncbi:MAG TPA: oxalate/formate MFS antiporter [Anaeromyxobacteraceae bacterium]|nr:oxalate/formate MFS antiporter [Anaeromyxobacteraceae bacterium]